MIKNLLFPNKAKWKKIKNKIENITPFSTDLFSAEQLENYGTQLAHQHEIAAKPIPDKLFKSLGYNERILKKTYESLSHKKRDDDNFSPASEWILDNFYLSQEHILNSKRNLPRRYGKALPQLTSGYPRVYDIALQMIEHSDGHLNLENVERYILAYQKVTLLTLGELWAIPIMLGLALIDILSKASRYLVACKSDRDLAASWANHIIEVAIADPTKLIILLADMAKAETSMTDTFVTELARRFQNAGLSLPLSYLEEHFAAVGILIEQVVQKENMQQAAIQVTVSNCIESLRRLNEVDWQDFIETMSIVDHTLHLDPTGTYGNMDFATRDDYRHAIERLARLSFIPENEVAKVAIALAKSKADPALAANENENPEKVQCAHVGFYLIDKGTKQLEKSLGIKLSLWQKMSWYGRKHILKVYLGSILLLTSIVTLSFIYILTKLNINTALLSIMTILLFIGISQPAINLINFLAMFWIKPKLLPRMDFAYGIPATEHTVVVVPSMLSNIEMVKLSIKELEVRFLANQDQHLQFVLLTDFNDATSEHLPEDQALLDLAKKGILALNAQYAKIDDIFFHFHRAREWNKVQHLWMGKERKRGKLTDFTSYLCGKKVTLFTQIVGNTRALANVKYVITLDYDTKLPRDTARELVATMAHPLNWPILDPHKNYVVSGYGILQPRMAEIIPGRPTRLIRFCGGEFGIDPYTRAVSNIYQDLFHEGSFMGKGIYNVNLYDEVLTDRFPNNRILSHDLLEGCYLRSGFANNVILYENVPSSYLSDVQRRIRWIRGDWQLLGWLLPWVRGQNHQIVNNPISRLAKFKLIDNLRRSLVSISLLVFLGLSLTILPTQLFLFGIFIGMIFFSTLLKIMFDVINKIKLKFKQQRFTQFWSLIGRETGQLIFSITCLPYEAWYSLSAIGITLWRLFISKKNLLEWVPSSQVEQCSNNSLLTWIKVMWAGPSIGLFILAIIFLTKQWQLLYVYLPLICLWFFSPLIAYWLSKPYQDSAPHFKLTEKRFLHQLARLTWEYFNVFVTAENNWLPPDNFQEEPLEALAKRTSPTNIGMYLLANLTAYDFNYIYMPQLLERTQHTFQTLLKLERFKGHLFNWYDTETLHPLYPRYVSTVDSGNLAGHLLTLRQGLLALPHEVLLKKQWLDGLQDTFNILMTFFRGSAPSLLMDFQYLLNQADTSFRSWKESLAISQALYEVARNITMIPLVSALSKKWADNLLSQCKMLHDEIELFSTIENLPDNATLQMISAMEIKQPSHPSVIKTIERIKIINSLAEEARSLAQMDMTFLQTKNNLFSIGFNVDEQRHDSGKYDLLSSEIRLGAFVAIAYGHILQKSWFALGRQFVSSGGESILVSWSGSMFEYLMPLLVMPTFPFTLLNKTYHSAVNRQIVYGRKRKVPWGISESGFNALDSQFNYLYQAFGVPDLGLKRGLEDNLVIAPYASVLALMVKPRAACLNLQRLAAEYGLGKYGFYEAIDFTPVRQPNKSKHVLIRSFMAHHQGMSFLALSYVLNQRPMQRRFIADPLFKAALLLLHERFPHVIDNYLPILPNSKSGALEASETSMRIFNSPNTRTPQVNLLSNGRYHTVITQSGGGYSRYKDIAITRWREDSTCDNWGLFTYVRDIDTGAVYSTAYQPTGTEPENFKCVFTEGHATFDRVQDFLDIHSEIVVSPEDDIELRRFRIYNRSSSTRTIELTSYGEIVLAPQVADESQAAFSNLFVETEILGPSQAILATRRTAEDEHSPWLCHLLNVYSTHAATLSFETSRDRFIGRTRSPAIPIAMLSQEELSNTSGPVLDPIFAIRCRMKLKPGTFVEIDLLTGIAETKVQCEKLVEKYQDRALANRIFELTWTHAQVLLHQLNITVAEAQIYNRLASPIIYNSKTRRANSSIMASNRLGQASLWSYAISGDLPIILLKIEDSANIEIVRQLIKAQSYWRHKRLEVDIIILNSEQFSYRQTLQDHIISLIKLTSSATTPHKSSIIVKKINEVSAEDLILLQSVARVILSDKRGTLKEQLSPRRVFDTILPMLLHTSKPFYKQPYSKPLQTLPSQLQFFNGLGGFNVEGNEYVINLKEGMTTPAPWCNVLANPNFGTLVSESGQGYTWIENSQQFRLTPWDNDPLEDTSGEALYIRDDFTGAFWSPTPLPCRGRGDYQIRHGFGYSVYEHIEEGVHSSLTMFVELKAPIKFFKLKISNHSQVKRSLSVFGFVAWVLGDSRSKNALHVVTETVQNKMICAQNHYNTDFGERTAFFAAVTAHAELRTKSITGDRTEFIGRNGTLLKPAALKRKNLSGRVGAGFDPCGAIQLAFDLEHGKSREIILILGAGQNKQVAISLVEHYCNDTASSNALISTREYWQSILGKIKFDTPDPAFNTLGNGWLIYQVISSRLWGRTGYYQSSGAFGFRDQLQDVMALSHCAPALYRSHLLLCAAHQFEEGDVEHWWHPPFNRGVRTRCSDDYLWLPFVLCHYVNHTNDFSILDESVPFLKGRPLKPDEESYYDTPTLSTQTASVYQHAVLAIKHSLTFGKHGLPLMGSGDWNDGMNKVGEKGQGESVWLGFFLYSVLKSFASLAAKCGDAQFAATCESESDQLHKNIKLAGWDGEWFRRAYFDDGKPLGSAENSECRIDSIAQSWAVISGAANATHAKKAMDSLYHYLVKQDDKLVKLLDPPFDKFRPSPGYIEAYLPGVRENGGQYTHAATWAIVAFAKLGEKEKAWQLFQLINPINHGSDFNSIMRYKIEAYVTAGDVYSVSPHIGRGGWSWYTGSAGWLYNVMLETLLGIQIKNGNELHLTPIFPANWKSFKLNYRYGNTPYKIHVTQTTAKRIVLDGIELTANFIILEDDGKSHSVEWM